MLIDSLLFILGLGILLASAKYFTSAAERIGVSLKMSPFLVGVIIVAVGTSLPELVSSIIATTSGKPEIVVGNVIGANISNIFLILGITTLFAGRNIYMGEEYLFIDLHFMLGSAILSSIFLWDGVINWVEGIFLLLGFVVYQFHLIRSDKLTDVKGYEKAKDVTEDKKKVNMRDILIVVIASIGVFLGADLTVSAIIDVAHHMAVNETYISLTALSLGTTLPELSVSITAARNGKSQIALGNILGSCIFNAFLVLGVSSTIAPVTIPEDMIKILLAFFLIASTFFYLLTHDKKISRWEGMLFLIFYVVFILKVTRLL